MKTNDTHVNQGNSLRNTAVFVGRTDDDDNDGHYKDSRYFIPKAT